MTIDRAVLISENQRLREALATMQSGRETERLMLNKTIVALMAHIIRLRYGWYSPAKEVQTYLKLLAQADDARRWTMEQRTEQKSA